MTADADDRFATWATTEDGAAWAATKGDAAADPVESDGFDSGYANAHEQARRRAVHRAGQ